MINQKKKQTNIPTLLKKKSYSSYFIKIDFYIFTFGLLIYFTCKRVNLYR
jgi:cbb3-type cytochrome oxidase subunit 1